MSNLRMENIITIPKSGWSSLELISSYDYGSLQGEINLYMGLAFIRWQGNNNIPDTNSLSIIIPDKYKPPAHVLVQGLTANSNNRTFIGNMEVRTDGKCNITFPQPNVSWTGCYVTYTLN